MRRGGSAHLGATFPGFTGVSVLSMRLQPREYASRGAYAGGFKGTTRYALTPLPRRAVEHNLEVEARRAGGRS